MTYSEALDAMNNGYCVSRPMMSRGSFLCISNTKTIFLEDIILENIPLSAKKLMIGRNKSLEFSKYIALVNKDNQLSPWSASSSDMFSSDWNIVDTSLMDHIKP